MKKEMDIKQTNPIKINIDAIPDYIRIELATAALRGVTEFLKQPGGREFLDKQIAEKNKRNKK